MNVAIWGDSRSWSSVWILLCLYPGLDHVQRTGDHTRHTAGRSSREHFQLEPDIPLSNPPLSQLLLLLVERKLQCREGHVTEQRCLEAGEERKKAFGAQYRSEGICRRSIVVSRFEERVIISALKL